MVGIDWSQLINLLVPSFLGFVFGIIGTWMAHRFERKRDQQTWQNELKKLQIQLENNKVLLEEQNQDKLGEIRFELEQKFQKRLQEVEFELEKKAQLEQEREGRQKLIQDLDDEDIEKKIHSLSKRSKILREGTLNAPDQIYLSKYEVVIPESCIKSLALVLFNPEQPISVKEFLNIHCIIEQNPEITSVLFLPKSQTEIILCANSDSLPTSEILLDEYWAFYQKVNMEMLQDIEIEFADLPGIVLFQDINHRKCHFISLRNRKKIELEQCLVSLNDDIFDDVNLPPLSILGLLSPLFKGVKYSNVMDELNEKNG